MAKLLIHTYTIMELKIFLRVDNDIFTALPTKNFIRK